MAKKTKNQTKVTRTMKLKVEQTIRYTVVDPAEMDPIVSALAFNRQHAVR